MTGSGRGIGRAFATEFAARGYSLIINCRYSIDQANSLKSSLEAQYHINAFVVADISKEPEVKSLVHQALSTFGKIDVLINNAGIAIDKDFSNQRRL